MLENKRTAGCAKRHSVYGHPDIVATVFFFVFPGQPESIIPLSPTWRTACENGGISRNLLLPCAANGTAFLLTQRANWDSFRLRNRGEVSPRTASLTSYPLPLSLLLWRGVRGMSHSDKGREVRLRRSPLCGGHPRNAPEFYSYKGWFHGRKYRKNV